MKRVLFTKLTNYLFRGNCQQLIIHAVWMNAVNSHYDVHFCAGRMIKTCDVNH